MNNITIAPTANGIVIEPAVSLVDISLFDVYTTTYFLSEAIKLEQHKEA